jgi:hypothetical protein
MGACSQGVRKYSIFCMLVLVLVRMRLPSPSSPPCYCKYFFHPLLDFSPSSCPIAFLAIRHYHFFAPHPPSSRWVLSVCSDGAFMNSMTERQLILALVFLITPLYLPTTKTTVHGRSGQTVLLDWQVLRLLSSLLWLQ